MEIREKAQAQIHDLYNDLMQREQTPALIDITDVLLQVYKKLDTVKNPEVWVNRLVNYIYIVGKASNVGFNRQEEAMLIALGDISKLAGMVATVPPSTTKCNFTGRWTLSRHVFHKRRGWQMAADFDQIVALVETALNDPEISKDPQLVKLLTKIGEDAMNKQYFYDDRRKFQPTVSMYALAHHHQLPPVLLTLLKVVQTPNAWGGF